MKNTGVFGVNASYWQARSHTRTAMLFAVHSRNYIFLVIYIPKYSCLRLVFTQIFCIFIKKSGMFSFAKEKDAHGNSVENHENFKSNTKQKCSTEFRFKAVKNMVCLSRYSNKAFSKQRDKNGFTKNDYGHTSFLNRCSEQSVSVKVYKQSF